MDFMQKIANIQHELKAPKGQFNKFGKYKYRSCEDILEAVKPLCFQNKVLMTLQDELVSVGDRYYVKATVTLYDIDSENKISNSAYARESLEKKGMDECQVTGSASSYARKYALNGIFCIDDTKDADTNEYHDTSNASEEYARYNCTICGKEIKSVKKSDGTVVGADKVYSSCGGLCLSCFNASKKGANNE